jgi:hypothetical protein
MNESDLPRVSALFSTKEAIFMGMSMSKFLRAIPSSCIRTRIRKAARRRGFVMGRIGSANKELLSEAVFEVEDEREHRHGHRDALVIAMRNVRNALYDALGWNEARAVER